jgi:alginate O-acetyltransferase complex protein AlgI
VVFSSITFLVYFLPILLLLYFIFPYRFRNFLLLIASIFFYSWGAPKFIFVILGTTFLDFYLVKLMNESHDPLKRKILMVMSISMNLGLLFYFKYCNFFIDNFNSIISSFNGTPIPVLNVILPIGISFYTFESLTYVIDVYRKVHAPLKNFWNYQLYIILFPKLIAGPIIRYHEIADQISDRKNTDNVDHRLAGFFRFSTGLAKKVFIANTMAIYADQVFNSDVNLLTAGTAWIGTLCYAFQIYFDFSGYSDMAIGLAMMFGFRFPENFDNPYTSHSITEFWRRWHITLGNWMRNYLYIPLGGNRVNSKRRLYLNLWLVFLASGLWHGASWTFIFWGAYHGAFLVIERIFLLGIYKRVPSFISLIVTFLIVCIGWVFFRSDSFTHSAGILSAMFSFDFSINPGLLNPQFFVCFLMAIFFSFFILIPGGKKIQENLFSVYQSPVPLLCCSVISCILIVCAVAAIASTNFNPFIYFRF